MSDEKRDSSPADDMLGSAAEEKGETREDDLSISLEYVQEQQQNTSHADVSHGPLDSIIQPQLDQSTSRLSPSPTPAPEQGNEEAAPEQGNEEDAPEQGNEEAAPEQGNEEAAPEQGNEEAAPEQGNEEAAPEQGNEEAAPEQGNEEAAPEQGNEEDAPEQGNEEAVDNAQSTSMKEEYASQPCSVCGAPADGLHYGAISCRSCNAFFRRTVVEKAQYRCKNNGQCIIDADCRCACRYCRFQKCLAAGMKVEAVQPRRDPTGAQKDRRKRALVVSPTPSASTSTSSPLFSPPTSAVLEAIALQSPSAGPSGLPAPTTPLKGGPGARGDQKATPSSSSMNVSLVSTASGATPRSTDSRGAATGDMPAAAAVAGPSNANGQGQVVAQLANIQAVAPLAIANPAPMPIPNPVPLALPNPVPVPCANCASAAVIIDWDQYQEFLLLINSYKEHVRMMQLNFATIDSFLAELDHGPQLRPMKPTDVEKLSTVELTGLLYWVEKLTPFKDLPEEDRSNLLKRYSVRKLSLDHFYHASKHIDHVKLGNFVMNNYTYVPPDKTGFELPREDEKQMSNKLETFTPTFKRFWDNVIHPFVEMKICDAEIVFLQVMLLWSVNNQEHVSEQTRRMMKLRREWAMKRLFDYYRYQKEDEPEVRFGQVTLLLGEIETICEMHCQDFLIAKLFDFCDMSKFWYESLCYTPVNTSKTAYDHYVMDNMQKFTALSFLDQTDATEMVVFTHDPPLPPTIRPLPVLPKTIKVVPASVSVAAGSSQQNIPAIAAAAASDQLVVAAPAPAPAAASDPVPVSQAQPAPDASSVISAVSTGGMGEPSSISALPTPSPEDANEHRHHQQQLQKQQQLQVQVTVPEQQQPVQQDHGHLVSQPVPQHQSNYQPQQPEPHHQSPSSSTTSASAAPKPSAVAYQSPDGTNTAFRPYSQQQ